MRKYLRLMIVTTTIACISVTNIAAKPMVLTYDGKQHQYNQDPIKLNVNGKDITTTVMPPVMINERVLVPVREVFEPLGAAIEWKNSEKKLYLSYQDKMMILGADDKNVWINGETIVVDVPAKLINDKVMVPVRLISENMNCDVEWVGGTTRTVFIEEIIEEPTPEPEPEPEVKPEPEPEPEVKPEPEPEPEPEVKPNPEQPIAPELDIEALFAGIVEKYEGETPVLYNEVIGKQFATTNINSIQVMGNKQETQAYIQATGPISNIQVTQEYGKIIIDILNSKSNLQSTITPANNTYIQNIRTSQYAANTTRVVLDLKSGAQTTVQLTPDRKGIYVKLTPAQAQDIAVGEDSKGDYLVIANRVPTQMQVEAYGKDGLMHITLPNTKIDEAFVWNAIDGPFIKEIYAVEINNDTEIVVVFQEDINFVHQIETMEGHTSIRFKEPTYKNISYVGGPDNTFVLSKKDGLRLEDIRVQDLYRNRQLIIDLGANYKDTYGYGTFAIDDKVVKNAVLKTEGTTKLVINEQIIHAVKLSEDNNNIYIELVRPKEKYGKIVILDIGHGGTDSGATGNGIREKDIAYRQAMRIKEKLENQTDIKVYMTREEDTTLTLAYRTELGNEIDGDIFVSIHNNSVPSNNKVSGTEVLYYPSNTDQKSMRMAQITQKHLVQNVGTVDRGIKSRGDLYVLRTSKMPAILLEGGFVSNPAEAARLNTPEFTEAYAQGAVDAIVEIFNTLSFR